MVSLSNKNKLSWLHVFTYAEGKNIVLFYSKIYYITLSLILYVLVT
jgi:uncharacterized protein YdeI (YjbR/CyaY-like superfamily)